LVRRRRPVAAGGEPDAVRLGYVRTEFPTQDGLRITRTDVDPDGERAGLVRLTLTSNHTRTLSLSMDAHSE